MVSLKQLHENLILEEIESNFFLHALNEEINDRAVGRVAGAIDKLDTVVQTLGLATLDGAMDLAQADADKVYDLDDDEAEKIISKITTFYSKITYLLQKAIPNLAKVNLKKFFGNNVPDATTLNDFDRQVAGILKKALTSNTGLFKRALASIFGDNEWTSGMPYLNIDAFVNEFMDLKKSDLKKIIGSLNTQAATLQPAQVFTSTAATAVGAPTSGAGGSGGAGGAAGGGGAPAPAGGGASGSGGGAAAAAVSNIVTSFDAIVDYLKTKFPGNDTYFTSDPVKSFILDQILNKKTRFDVLEKSFAAIFASGGGAPAGGGGAPSPGGGARSQLADAIKEIKAAPSILTQVEKELGFGIDRITAANSDELIDALKKLKRTASSPALDNVLTNIGLDVANTTKWPRTLT